MLATEFHKRLHEISVDYSRKAILKWAHKGLVAPPRGRTKSALWTDEALGEAAAVYALRKREVSFQIIDQIIGFVRLLPSDPSLLSSADLNSAEFPNNNNVPYSILSIFYKLSQRMEKLSRESLLQRRQSSATRGMKKRAYP